MQRLDATDAHPVSAVIVLERLKRRDLGWTRPTDAPGLLEDARFPDALRIDALRNIVISPGGDDALVTSP